MLVAEVPISISLEISLRRTQQSHSLYRSELRLSLALTRRLGNLFLTATIILKTALVGGKGNRNFPSPP